MLLSPAPVLGTPRLPATRVPVSGGSGVSLKARSVWECQAGVDSWPHPTCVLPHYFSAHHLSIHMTSHRIKKHYDGFLVSMWLDQDQSRGGLCSEGAGRWPPGLHLAAESRARTSSGSPPEDSKQEHSQPCPWGPAPRHGGPFLASGGYVSVLFGGQPFIEP